MAFHCDLPLIVYLFAAASKAYTMAIDMWAAGCIVAELFRGEPILPGKNEADQVDQYNRNCNISSMVSRLFFNTGCFLAGEDLHAPWYS